MIVFSAWLALGGKPFYDVRMTESDLVNFDYVILFGPLISLLLFLLFFLTEKNL